MPSSRGHCAAPLLRRRTLQRRLDFVCGKSGSYFTDVEFKDLIETALETTRRPQSDFGIDSNQISLKKPEHPDLVSNQQSTSRVQIIVPVEATPMHRIRIKIEFANVPAYARTHAGARTPGLVQVEDVILTVELRTRFSPTRRLPYRASSPEVPRCLGRLVPA